MSSLSTTRRVRRFDASDSLAHSTDPSSFFFLLPKDEGEKEARQAPGWLHVVSNWKAPRTLPRRLQRHWTGNPCELAPSPLLVSSHIPDPSIFFSLPQLPYYQTNIENTTEISHCTSIHVGSVGHKSQVTLPLSLDFRDEMQQIPSAARKLCVKIVLHEKGGSLSDPKSHYYLFASPPTRPEMIKAYSSNSNFQRADFLTPTADKLLRTTYAKSKIGYKLTEEEEDAVKASREGLSGRQMAAKERREARREVSFDLRPFLSRSSLRIRSVSRERSFD